MTTRISLALLAMSSICLPAASAQTASRPHSDWDQVLKRLGPQEELTIEPAVKASIESAVVPALPVSVVPAGTATVAVGAITPVAVDAGAPVAALSVAPAEPQGDLPISFGRFVRSDRDALYNSGKYVELNYVDEPMQNVLRRLARASGINFIMPKIDGATVSLSQRGNPFSIMESMIESQGMGLVRRGDTWLITSLDRVNLKPEVYKLTHIHLDREFSFRDNTVGGRGNSPGLGQQGGQLGGFGGQSGGLGGQPGGFGGQSGGQQSSMVTNPANLAAPRSVEERSSGDSQLLSTLEKILEFGMDNSMEPNKASININGQGGEGEKRGKRATSKAIYSYDPDANSLFVVATEQQHAWVQKWLSTIDQPTRNIEIEIQFISTGKSNGKSMGVDWTGGSSGNGFGNGLGLNIKDAATTGAVPASPGSITFGPLNGIKAPVSSILSSDALTLRLKAMLTNTDTRTTKKPLLTTLTNREVLINNTQNQPVVLANTSGSTTSGGGGGSTTAATSSAISNENIGTVTRILPRIISGDLISLSINIDITNLLRTTVINGNEYPIIAKTGFTNEVKVRSGYSVIIGGLEEMITRESVRKLPLLGNIPFFGFAFKDIVKGDDISNLSLIITVRIIDESGNEYKPDRDKPVAATPVAAK